MIIDPPPTSFSTSTQKRTRDMCHMTHDEGVCKTVLATPGHHVGVKYLSMSKWVNEHIWEASRDSMVHIHIVRTFP